MLSLKQTCKRTALNNHGIAHYIIPLAVVLLVAVGGTFVLVASHADSVPKPKIASVSLATPYTVTGTPEGCVNTALLQKAPATCSMAALNGGAQVARQWCATIPVTYTVRMTGIAPKTLSQVEVIVPNAQASQDPMGYFLKNSGNGYWIGTVPHPGICTKKRGAKAPVKLRTADTVTAIFTNATGLTDKNVRDTKTVKIN